MIAFEISVNEKPIQTIAVGEFGILTADVMWTRIQTKAGPIHEEFRTMSRGLEGHGGDAVHWPNAQLKVGDAVTIRIVDVDSLRDPPSERTSREQVLARATRPPEDADSATKS